MRTLQDVADILAGSSEKRKILIWVGPGIPVNPAVQSTRTSQSGLVIGSASDAALLDELPEVFRQMQRSKICIVYPIDPTGVDGLASYVEREMAGQPALAWPQKAQSYSLGAVPLTAVPAASDRALRGEAGFDFLEETADNTGGRAIVHTEDFAPGIDALFRENGSYYLLGYRATDPGSGKLHRLDVQVDRPGVTVQAQRGYYASDAKADARRAKTSPVERTIASALPGGSLPMLVMLAPFASTSASGATVVIALGVSQPAPIDRTTGTMDIETKAFTPTGDARGSRAQTVRLTLAGAAPEIARYQLVSQFDLRPGRYQLRIGAHSSIGDLTGGVFADVEVPDFASAPISLSGVLIEATPAPPSMPKDALAAVVPVTPTIERIFDPRDHASAFVRVYEGGASPLVPITLHVTLVNEKGETMVGRDDTIPAWRALARKPAQRTIANRAAAETNCREASIC